MNEQSASISPSSTVGDIARSVPEAIAVFEEVSLDYSCKGSTSLTDAAASAGLSVDDILNLISAAKPASANRLGDSIASLLRFLVEDHEKLLVRSLPDMRRVIEVMVAEHPVNRDLQRISRLFADFSAHLTDHISREELEVFPALERLEAAVTGGGRNRERISQSVLREFVEHESLGQSIRLMRELALEPRLACGGQLLEHLSSVKRDMNYHMHVENNILYPRALEMENAVRHASG